MKVEGLVKWLRDPDYSGPYQHLRDWKDLEEKHTDIADLLEAQAKAIEEMREALRQERVRRMVAEGAGAEQARIHANVQAGQDERYLRDFLASHSKGGE